jgi:hypothetical protein
LRRLVLLLLHKLSHRTVCSLHGRFHRLRRGHDNDNVMNVRTCCTKGMRKRLTQRVSVPAVQKTYDLTEPCQQPRT